MKVLPEYNVLYAKKGLKFLDFLKITNTIKYGESLYFEESGMLDKTFSTVNTFLVKSGLFVFLGTKPVIAKYSEVCDGILKKYKSLKGKSEIRKSSSLQNNIKYVWKT